MAYYHTLVVIRIKNIVTSYFLGTFIFCYSTINELFNYSSYCSDTFIYKAFNIVQSYKDFLISCYY